MNNISNILIIIESPFSQRDYNRFGIDVLKSNGFSVSVLDLSPVLQPKLVQAVLSNFNCPELVICNSPSCITRFLKPISDFTFVVNLVGYRSDSMFLYRALSRHNLRYAVFTANAIPSPSHTGTGKITGITSKIKKITPLKLYRYFCSRVPCQLLGIRPADLVLAGGGRSLSNCPFPTNRDTQVLWAHTLDFDLFLEARNDNTRVCDQETCVFLDVFLPFHPDSVVENIPCPTTAENYYPSLCRFFDHVERELNVRVVIAAHPRSNYDQHPDYFDGRQIVKGKTIELVRDSLFTILHSSTSLNYAVLFDKPMIFITTDELVGTLNGNYIEAFAEYFGARSINIDKMENITLREEIKLSKENYLMYRRSYIKQDASHDLPFWQLVANYCRNLT